MLVNTISTVLVGLFAYGLVVNFRRGNFSYSFVMYVGMIIFYANLYRRLSTGWSFSLLMAVILLAAILATSFTYQAVTDDDNRHHYWGATALSVLAIVLALLFYFIL